MPFLDIHGPVCARSRLDYTLSVQRPTRPLYGAANCAEITRRRCVSRSFLFPPRVFCLFRRSTFRGLVEARTRAVARCAIRERNSRSFSFDASRTSICGSIKCQIDGETGFVHPRDVNFVNEKEREERDASTRPSKHFRAKLSNGELNFLRAINADRSLFTSRLRLKLNLIAVDAGRYGVKNLREFDVGRTLSIATIASSEIRGVAR